MKADSKVLFMNKNTKIFTLVVLTLLSASCFFYFLNHIKTASTTEPDFVLTGMECYDSVNYFAIQEPLTDANGSKILIKYKTSPSATFPCAYVVAIDDFEIKEVIAGYFLTFTDNFLVLEIGTGPSFRKLIVYDLRSRKEIFSDTYEEPVKVKGDSITYLSYTRSSSFLNFLHSDAYKIIQRHDIAGKLSVPVGLNLCQSYACWKALTEKHRQQVQPTL